MVSRIARFWAVKSMWCKGLKVFAVITVLGGLLACTRLPNAQFAVVCYNEDGGLFEEFGEGGKVLTDIGSSESEGAATIAFAPVFYDGPNGREGNIFLAGDAMVGDGHQFALVRYKEWDGSLEERFGEDGIVLTDFPSARSQSALDIAYAIVANPTL